MDISGDDKLRAHFWARVEKTDGCWLWTAGKTAHGYGTMTVRRKTLGVHRVALELHLGRRIQEGYLVAHAPVICHNRACVNPAHLREATRSENSGDMRLDGTVLLGKDNPKPRQLTEDQVRAIRNDKRSQGQIARAYKLTQPMVSRIKNNYVYCWVK